MIPVNTKTLVAVLAGLSVTGVHAGPCKPITSQTNDATVTSTAEITSTALTTTETESATSTTATAASTSSSASCPAPPSCGNQGFDWAYYNNPARNTDTTYSTFHPDSFKNADPTYVGTTSYVGGLYQSGPQGTSGSIYGSTNDLNLDFFALNHHAYLYACEAGTYHINIPYANDAVYLWIGAKAYSGWTDENADAKARYNQPDHIAGQASFSFTLPANSYMPIRFVYGQAQYGGGFNFDITTPSGQVIASNDATSSTYIVRYSCDRVTAPQYPSFGMEI